MNSFSLLVILSCAIAVVIAKPASNDPKNIYNTIEGSDDAEIVPELINSHGGENKSRNPSESGEDKFVSTTLYGSGIRYYRGDLLLNGKPVTIDKKDGYIQCNALKCPPEAVKCAIRAKLIENTTDVSVVSKCGDKDNKVVLEDKSTEKADSSEDGPCGTNAYIEVSFAEGEQELLDSEISKEIEDARSEMEKILKAITDSFRNAFNFPLNAVKDWWSK